MTPCQQLQQDFEAEIANLSEDDRVLWLRFTSNAKIKRTVSLSSQYMQVSWQGLLVVSQGGDSKHFNKWSARWKGSFLINSAWRKCDVAKVAITAIREHWLPSVTQSA